MKKILLLLIAFPLIANSLPQFSERNCLQEGFLPKNKLYIPASANIKSGITLSEFNDVIDKVEMIYSSIIRQYGGILKIERLWEDGTVNASANRKGDTYLVKMYGGLARHYTITKDAFTLVACHELGHHIGGVPRYTTAGGSWASVEGQSDYFATLKCMRRIFENEDNENIVIKLSIDPLVKKKCEEQHSNHIDALICQRISMAGLSSASLFAASQNRAMPRFDTPDRKEVTKTEEGHPEYQCRLDTYFQGAICPIPMTTEIGQQDENTGTCNFLDGYQEGQRPPCWYKSQLGSSPHPRPTPTPIPNYPTAETPNSSGSTTVQTHNPDQVIPIYFDVSQIPQTIGMGIEISLPNQIFENPNDMKQDFKHHLKYNLYKRTSGTYNFIPRKELPNYGRYQIRIIALDYNKNPTSRFSNSFTIEITN